MIQNDLKPFTQCRVLIVDDESMSRAVLEAILEPVFQCELVTSGYEAIAYCKEHDVDLVLLDMNMPEFDGLAVCTALREDERTQLIPVIFVTATLDATSENTCWEVGASDFVVKPVNASTLIHRVKTHIQNKLRTDFLEKMTFHDQLTGLYNRMYLSNEVPALIKQLARDNAPVGALMIDIDYFKLFNDTYGHLDGDICLQRVANIIRKTVKRPKDLVIRFGGEEFLVLLPYTDKRGVELIASKLIESVREADITHEKGIDGSVSISAGYSIMNAQSLKGGHIAPLLESADNQLFEAKAMGRNQACGQQALLA